ncbi:MAG: HAD family hydrolase [Pseudomonadales bacterium]|nr:HAD family hydrolase [Pseudomonadales bacterium]
MIQLPDNIRARAAKIRLLCLDVDGVLTSGHLHYSADGEQLKVFNSLDGHGIKMLQASGVDIAIISGRRSEALIRRGNDLGIKHLYLGCEDKLTHAKDLLEKLNLDFSQFAHVGDDLPDLPLITRAELGICVNNAHWLLKQNSNWQTQLSGGEGAVREVCDLIMHAQGNLDKAHAAYLETDT